MTGFAFAGRNVAAARHAAADNGLAAYPHHRPADWASLVELLGRINAEAETRGSYNVVEIPRRLLRPAARLIGELGLEDYVELVARCISLA